MQIYKKTQEAKTFPQIWESLSKSERSELRAALISELRISDSTLWRWGSGASRPISYSQSFMATKVVNDTLGKSLTTSDLFPEK